MKPKVNYLEYPSFNELFKRADEFIYRVKYNGEYVYFIQMASYVGEYFVHLFISTEKLDGFVTTDTIGNALVHKEMRSGVTYIPIIVLKNTSFMDGWINEYKTKIKQSV